VPTIGGVRTVNVFFFFCKCLVQVTREKDMREIRVSIYIGEFARFYSFPSHPLADDKNEEEECYWEIKKIKDK
jgi:hypothetical protein